MRMAAGQAAGTWACVALLLAVARPCDASETLVLLDGKSRSATVTAIDADGQVACRGTGPVALSALRRIERRGAVAKPGDGVRVYLTADGGLVHGTKVVMTDQRLALHWAHGSPLALPLDLVSAVLFAAEEPDAFRAARLEQAGKLDALHAVAKDGAARVVHGGLERIGEDEVVFIWDETPRTLPRARVQGCILAAHGNTAPPARQARVMLNDGSSLAGDVEGLAGNRLTLKLSPSTSVVLPWKSVRRLDVRSDRLVFLSDEDPVDVEQAALVTFTGWARDRNLRGQPLKLGDRVYEKGLAVHSQCRLSYELGGRYQTFAATIGIDASARGDGDCVFRVVADGQELFAERVRGSDAPRPVRLGIAGAKRLVLAVEWGEGLDLGDHGNWCDARVLKD